MYSLSIDYLFNRVYDVLLWIKYTWLFGILRHDKGEYLLANEGSTWDGLRDRGWFDSYLANLDKPVPEAERHISLWERFLDKLGIVQKDTDNDGIPDASDESPYDPNNLSQAQIKERFEEDYTFGDHVRDLFGLPPKDTDNDGVPDSYEDAHGLDKTTFDSDRDGIPDGKELTAGTDPLNNDSDKDLVIDGRDEAPLDGSVSSIGPDRDGDGVSDEIEQLLGTNPQMADTDKDGIPDGMDTYPLDPQNLDQVAGFDIHGTTTGIHFAIQNPFLAFMADILSIASIAVILVIVYASFRWFLVFWQGLNHYDHHFEHDEGHDGSSATTHHVIKHHEETLPAGIANLPIFQDASVHPPEEKAYKEHPKFAIIQGYMSSQSEALWRIGLMEADNLLAEALREKGYQGEGVAEMLKNASFKTVQLAWDAHKVRNRIAHEGSNFELTAHEAKRAFTLYESVLRELKVI